jgi:hypothetical protein
MASEKRSERWGSVTLSRRSKAMDGGLSSLVAQSFHRAQPRTSPAGYHEVLILTTRPITTTGRMAIMLSSGMKVMFT